MGPVRSYRNKKHCTFVCECRLWNRQAASSSGRLAFSISFEFVSFMHICLLFEWHQISNYFRTRTHFHFRLSTRRCLQIANANVAKECTTMTNIVPKSTRRTKHAHMREYCNEILSSALTHSLWTMFFGCIRLHEAILDRFLPPMKKQSNASSSRENVLIWNLCCAAKVQCKCANIQQATSSGCSVEAKMLKALNANIYFFRSFLCLRCSSEMMLFTFFSRRIYIDSSLSMPSRCTCVVVCVCVCASISDIQRHLNRMDSFMHKNCLCVANAIHSSKKRRSANDATIKRIYVLCVCFSWNSSTQRLFSSHGD